jgi:uncharacterized membrane protein YkoI
MSAMRLNLIAVSGVSLVAALLAVPLFLGAERTYNERRAIVGLKGISVAEADFRSNDRDGNRVMDFWTADVYALYGMIGIAGAAKEPPADSTDGSMAIKLIWRSLAAADGRSDQALYGNQEFASAFDLGGRPSRGYFFRALHNEITGGTPTTLLNDTDGKDQFYLECHDNDRYAFAACPVSLKAGGRMFVINEDNTIWQLKLPATYLATFEGCTGAVTDSTSTALGAGMPPEFTLTGDPEQGTFPGRPAAAGLTRTDDKPPLRDFAPALAAATLTLSEAVDRALKEAKEGSAVQAALEEQDGRSIFIVDVAQKDKVLEVRVDAKEGAVLSKSAEYENWIEPLKTLKVTLKDAIAAAEKKSSGKPVAAHLRKSEGEPYIQVALWKNGTLELAKVDISDGGVK